MDGPTFSEQPQRAEALQKVPKERDVLKGNLVHLTTMDRISSILEKGLLSTQAAQASGIEGDFTKWDRSRKDQVYLYEQVESPEDNNLFLLITGAPRNQIHKDNIAVVISSVPDNPLQIKPADPTFPSVTGRPVFSEERQKMVQDKLGRENIQGIILVAGPPPNNYENQDMKDQLSQLQKDMETVSQQNPDLAVPIYDQNGNMLWPVKKTREEILKSL